MTIWGTTVSSLQMHTSPSATGGLTCSQISPGLFAPATSAKLGKLRMSLSHLQSLCLPHSSVASTWTPCTFQNPGDLNISSKVDARFVTGPNSTYWQPKITSLSANLSCAVLFIDGVHFSKSSQTTALLLSKRWNTCQNVIILSTSESPATIPVPMESWNDLISTSGKRSSSLRM